MDLLDRRYYDSSDDSDIVPPTPAAKSTPHAPPNKLSKEKHSLNSSLNRPTLQSPFTAAQMSDTDSSPDEKSALPKAQLKIEHKSTDDSSSSNEDKEALVSTSKSHFSSASLIRQVHAMSSTDDSDDEPGPDWTEHPNQMGFKLHQEPLKAGVIPTHHVSKADDSDSSSNETIENQDSVEASDDEREERRSTELHQLSSNADNKPACDGTGDSDGESEAQAEQKPYERREKQSDSSDSDSSNIVAPHTLPTEFRNYNDSSDEADEEITSMQMSHGGKNQNDTTASEESREDRGLQYNASSQSLPVLVTDKRELSGSESSDEEMVEKKFDPHQLEKLRVEALAVPTGRNQCVLDRPSSMPVPVPTTSKRGKALLQETFKESEVVSVENASLIAEDIGSDDEVWLLQCPASMDIKSLKNKFINLSAEHDIQLDDGPTFKRFTIKPEINGSNIVHCLLPLRSSNQFQISSLPLKGQVVIQDHVHVPKLKLPKAPTKGHVAMPSSLKVRHPLLGVGFQEHIAQAKKALKHARKIKKKDRKNTSVCEEVNEDATVDSQLSLSLNDTVPSLSVTPQPKAKKKSHQRNEKLLSTSGRGLAEVEDSKKKGKESSGKKRNEYSMQNLKDDQSSLNGSHKKKYMKIAKDICKESNQTLETGSEVSLPHGHSWHIPQIDDIPVGLTDYPESSQVKKSSKARNGKLLETSAIKQEPGSSMCMNGQSVLDTSVTKKRKWKEVCVKSEPETFLETPPKKHKRV